MWGIGTRIAKRLGTMNIITLGDLARAPVEAVKKEFGINGIVFRKLARGEDTSEIFRKTEHEKCLNHHHTLSDNIYKPEDVIHEIRRIGEYICRKLRSKELVAGYLHLTLRFEDLRYAGNETRLKRYTNDDREIFEAAIRIHKSFPHPGKNYKARMFGMSVFDLHPDQKRNNLELFEKKVMLPYYALDKLKYKYGEGIIRVGIKD
jgi:nucleotidyltransferase/DNA polymerase involved in DNA repair